MSIHSGLGWVLHGVVERVSLQGGVEDMVSSLGTERASSQWVNIEIHGICGDGRESSIHS